MKSKVLDENPPGVYLVSRKQQQDWQCMPGQEVEACQESIPAIQRIDHRNRSNLQAYKTRKVLQVSYRGI